MRADGIMPPRKDRHVPIALPTLETDSEAEKATAALVEAVAVGVLTRSVSAELSKLVEGFIKAVEVRDLESRLTALEQRNDLAGRRR